MYSIAFICILTVLVEGRLLRRDDTSDFFFKSNLNVWSFVALFLVLIGVILIWYFMYRTKKTAVNAPMTPAERQARIERHSKSPRHRNAPETEALVPPAQ